MADVNDIHDFDGVFEDQREKLAEMDVDERDRRAIEQFIARRMSQVKKSTVINNLSCLMGCLEKSDITLVDADKEDIDILLLDLSEGTCPYQDEALAEGTLRNYRKALKRFYEHQEVEWYEDIEIGSPVDRDINTDELLDSDEIDDLFDACTNPRDRAMLALFADTGLRVGALGTLRIKDIELVGKGGKIQINEEAAGTKGAKGPFPITWSRGYLVSWLNSHPDAENDDAPLFHVLVDRSDIEGKALADSYIRNVFKRVARRADIDPSRLKPHNFRHRRITNWRRQGKSEGRIEHRAGWKKGSRMMRRYDHVEREEACERELADLGLIEVDETDSMSFDTCPQCGMGLPDSMPRFCPSCGMPLRDEAIEFVEEFEEDSRESLIELEPDEARAVDEVTSELVDNPDVLREVVADVMDDS